MPDLYEPRMSGQSMHGGRNILIGLNNLCIKYSMNKTHNILELGSNDGVSSKLFASYANNVYCLDLQCSNKLKETLSNFNNIKLIRGDLSNTINNFDNNYFDFIYIDADHSRTSVLKDIGLCIPKLKNNGILCGHDFEHHSNNAVKHAVETIFPKEEISFFGDTSWAVKLDKEKIFNDTPIYLLIFNTINLQENTINIINTLSKYFTKIFHFDEYSLKQLPNSENVCNSFNDPLPKNPHANNIGYFDFKPFLLKHILNEIPENSILLYHDGNFTKYPKYWNSQWSHIKELLQLLLYNNSSDIFVPLEPSLAPLKHHVKKYTINQLFNNDLDKHIISNSKIFAANKIVVKNTEFSRNFINEWHNLCQNKDLISPKPNPNPDIEFKWSCGDQDVLNCLIYKYILNKSLPPTFPIYYFPDRIFSFANIHRQYNQFIIQNFISNNHDELYKFYNSLL